MGSRSTNIVHYLNPLTSENAAQNQPPAEDFDTAIGGLLGIGGVPVPEMNSKWTEFPPDVRRTLELLDRLDQHAETFRECTESMIRTYRELMDRANEVAATR